MSPSEVGLIGIALLLLLLLLRMHVALAMALVGFLGLAYLTSFEVAASLLAKEFFAQFSAYSLSAIPMFVLMGSFAQAAGLGEQLYRAARALVGAVPGGLSVATVLACGGFAAISGSSAATAATMGRMALPEMRRYGYNLALAGGSVAAAGTLGILIPPSTVLLVYAFLAQQPVGPLFMAGLLPGILLTLLFALTAYLICRARPDLGPTLPPVPWGQRLRASLAAWPVLLLFLLVVGGLFFGWYGPTQAGAVGAAGALVLGLLNRRISLWGLLEATQDALRTSTVILALIAGAMVFGRFMAVTRIPFDIGQWIGGLELPPYLVFAIIVLIFFVGGFFMDSMALVVLLMPVVYPVVLQLGFDPIWFGVIIVLVSELGVITPPVGINVYVIKGIAPEIPLAALFRGIMPYILPILLMIGLLTRWPQIALWLPGLAR